MPPPSFPVKRRILLCLALAGVLGAGAPPAVPTAKAAFTEPIGQEVWAMGADPALVAVGAVVLQDHWTIGLPGNQMERLLRVRILSSGGRAMAGIEKSLAELVQVEGRVSYPDGTSMPITAETDLHEKVLFGLPGYENHSLRRSILEVPGLNSDCVLEIRLLYGLGNNFPLDYLDLQNPFPTRELVVEMRGKWSMSILFRLDPRFKGETVTRGEVVSTTFRDLPALEATPFRSNATARGNRLYIYPTQQGIVNKDFTDPRVFWQSVTNELWERSMAFAPFHAYGSKYEGSQLVIQDKPRKGYDALLKELIPGLPALPQARAIELHRRLCGRIKQWENYGAEHMELLRNLTRQSYIVDRDTLEPYIEAGGAPRGFWTTLYWNLLRDAGVSSHLVMAVPEYRFPLLLQLRTTSQFLATLIRVEEPGKRALFLDPSAKDGHPERVPAWFQGTEALAVDTRTWTLGLAHLPWQAPDEDREELVYQVEPQPGLARFQLRGEFLGAADSRARAEFLDLDGASRGALLARTLAGGDLDLAVDPALVGDPLNHDKPFSVSATGRQRIGGGEVLRFPAFPAHPVLFDPPATFPESRVEPIRLGPPRTWHWTSRVSLPKGHRWIPERPMDTTTPFAVLGRTAKLSQDGTAVDVEFRVTTLSGSLEASAYGDFRRFLVVLKEAMETPIVLERLP